MTTITRELKQKFKLAIVPSFVWQAASCHWEEMDNTKSHEYLDELLDALVSAALEVRGIALLQTDDTKGEYNIPALVTAANRKVDAILDQERQAIGKINYPKRESLPEPIRDLIDAWVSATGIKPLAREAMGWLSEGQNWLNLHATAKDVIAAFDYAKANYPAMPTTPFGLTNTLRAYKAGTLKSTTISADRRPSVETL